MSGECERRVCVAGEADGGLRIDVFLAAACPDCSRSFLQRLLKEGNVTAGGKPVKSSYRVSAGETVCCEIPAAAEPEIAPEAIPLDILYEDADVIVVNKPKGMVV